MPVYAPHDTLARISNKYFAQYANANNIFHDVKVEELKESDVTPILKAIQELPDTIREKVEQDLRNIAELSDNVGICALFAELNGTKAENIPEFRKRGGGHDKSIWVLMNYPSIFQKVLDALFFRNTSGTFTSFRYETENKPDLSKKATDQLTKKIREYFQMSDGRGKFCVVEKHEVGDFHYLIASPSEHPDIKREFKSGGKLEPTKRQDAFTTVFIFSEEGNSVNIYVDALKDVKRSLFEIWAKEIMGLDKVDTDQKDSFELKDFAKAEQDFSIPADSCVESLSVYSLKFIPADDLNKKYHITAKIDGNPKALYDELKKRKLKPFIVESVWLEATIIDGDKRRTKRFEVSATSCKLRHEGIEGQIRKMLKDVGIDVTK